MQVMSKYNNPKKNSGVNIFNFGGPSIPCFKFFQLNDKSKVLTKNNNEEKHP